MPIKKDDLFVSEKKDYLIFLALESSPRGTRLSGQNILYKIQIFWIFVYFYCCDCHASSADRSCQRQARLENVNFQMHVLTSFSTITDVTFKNTVVQLSYWAYCTGTVDWFQKYRGEDFKL